MSSSVLKLCEQATVYVVYTRINVIWLQAQAKYQVYRAKRSRRLFLIRP